MTIFNSVMMAVYIIFNILPFSILRYYPFLNKLRISLWCVVSILLSFAAVETGIYVYIMNNAGINTTEIQIYRVTWMAIFAVFSFIIIKDNLFKQFFVYMLMAIYGSLVYGRAHFIEASIFHDFSKNYPYTAANIAIIIQLIITFPVAFSLMKNHFRIFINSVESDIWRVIWLIPFTFYGVAAIFTIDLDISGNWEYIFTRYMLFVGAVAVCYVLFKALNQAADNAVLKQQLNITDRQLAIQEQQYSVLTENIEETRKARHDLRHHLSLVRKYVEEDNREELIEYLEEQRRTLPADAEEIICENTAVNVLAGYYIRLAREKEIKTDFKINIPEDVKIADIDLSIIFGNCLENAFEACKRMETGDRLIRVRAGRSMGDIIIVIGNTFDGCTLLGDNEFLSMKRNGGKGIGINSVKAVAKKYGGCPEYEAGESFFKVSIVLRTD